MDGSRGRGGPAPTRVRGWAGRYGMALAVTGAAAILQAAAGRAPGDQPAFSVLGPAVMLVALTAGAGPGLVATALGVAFAARSRPDAFRDASALGPFVASGLVGGAFAAFLGLSRRRASRAGATPEAGAESAWADAAHLSLFVEHAPAALAMLDREMRYLAASRRWMRDYGLGDAELLGRSHYDVFPEIPPRWREVHRRALHGETIRAEEDEFARADGTRTWLRWEVRPWRDAAGDVGGLLIFTEDVTALKQSETALRLSEQRQAAILAALAARIAVLDRDGVITAVNTAWDEFMCSHGGSRERCGVGSNYLSVCDDATGADSASAREAAEGIRAVGGGRLAQFSLEYTCGTPGRPARYVLNVTPLRHGPGGVVVAHIDISDRARAEEKADVDRARLEAALNSMTDAVFISDAEGRFVEFNDAFVTFHRFRSRAELLPTLADYPAVLDVALPDGTPAPLELWAVPRALRGETATEAEYHLRRRDTGESWVGSYNFAPIRDADGVIVGSVVVGRDVTVRKRDEEALRRSERRWRDLAEALPQLVWTCAPDGVCDYLSRQWVEYTGRPEAEQLGDGWLGRIHPDDRDRLRAAWAEAVADGVEFDVEFRIRRADGVYRWFKTRAVPVRGADGRVSQWFGSNTDIEDLRQAAYALRQSEERLRLAVRASHIGLWDWDVPSGRVVYSPEWKAQLGYAEAEVGDDLREWETRVHPDDLGPTWDHIRRALASAEAAYEAEFRMRHKDGSWRWIYARAETIRDPSGAPARVLGCHVDVTGRRADEAALRERESRLAAILDTASDAIITIDERGVVLTANRAAERLFGYPGEELLGRDVGMLMPSPYREEHGRYLARYLETKRPRIIGIGREIVARRKDGTVFPADLAVSEIGQLRQFTGIIRDATRRKELERDVVEAASQQQRQIGQDLHDTIGQELTALNLLAGGILDALAEGPDHAGCRPIAEKLARGLRRCQSQLRVVMRGLLPVPVDAEGLMAALADLAERTRADARIDCRFDCPEPVDVDDNLTATHLYLIAQEAVRNAVRHARPRVIRIALSARPDLILSVRDDGVGPPSPDPAQGLGLRVMRNRAAIIGARLTIGPAAPAGTEVVCEFPR